MRGRAHQVADHAAVVHLDQGGRHGSVVRAVAAQVAGDPRRGREGLDQGRPRAGDDHDRAQGVRAIVVEVEPAADAQTPVENNATGVATANSTDDVAVASADANDGMAVSENDDVAVATADDVEVLDGTESEEHISTY